MSRQTASLYLETKNFMTRGMGRASAQVDRFKTKTTSAARVAHSNISSIGDRVTALGKANASFAIGLGAIGAAAFGVKQVFDIINAGLQPAQDLETAMSGVKAVMSTAADKSQIPLLRKQAIALAGAGDLAFFTAVQVAASQKMLIKSGQSAQQTMQSTAATLAIAGAEEIALGNAADFTTNIMSSFALQANQSTDAANMLAQASRTSNTNITELADGAAQGAASFKKFGGSLGEFLALGGTLAGFGIKGGDFGTGIKAMTVSLAQLGAETKKGENLRKMLAISRADIVDKHGNIDAIKALALIGRKTGLDRIKIEDKFGKQTEASAAKAVMGNAEVTRVLAKIFKQYQFGKIAILAQEAALGKVQKRVEDYNKQIGLGQQGAAFDVMREKMDNTEGSATRLASAWDTLLVNLGSPFLTTKRGVLDYLTELLNITNALVTGNFKEFFIGAGEKAASAAQLAVPGGIITRTGTAISDKILGLFGLDTGVPKTGTTGDETADTSTPTGSSESETNIIFTGNNEFHNESLEQEVFNLATVSY